MISVIIPALNEEKYLERCLSALHAQRTRVSYEIIVVDNGSTDHTAAIAKQYDASLISEPKKGYSRALYAGISRAKGDFIALIDADTVVTPLWITRIRDICRMHPDALCIGGPAHFYDGSPRIRKVFSWLVHVGTALHLLQPMGFNMVVRKSALLRVQFDERINLQWDRFFVNQMRKHGKIVFTRALTVSMSSRRWRSPRVILIESCKRLINLVSLALAKRAVFSTFENFR